MIVATVVELMKRRILNPRVDKEKATLVVSLGLRPALRLGLGLLLSSVP